MPTLVKERHSLNALVPKCLQPGATTTRRIWHQLKAPCNRLTTVSGKWTICNCRQLLHAASPTILTPLSDIGIRAFCGCEQLQRFTPLDWREIAQLPCFPLSCSLCTASTMHCRATSLAPLGSHCVRALWGGTLSTTKDIHSDVSVDAQRTCRSMQHHEFMSLSNVACEESHVRNFGRLVVLSTARPLI